MKFYVDTANVDEIKKACRLGIISGVTSNPVLIRKSGTQDVERRIKDIRDCIGEGEILTQVIAREEEEIVRQAEIIHRWDANITVKVPLTLDGIPAISRLSKMGISTCATVVYDASQALAAAAAGAKYVAMFLNRTNARGLSGFTAMQDIIDSFKIQGLKTQIIAASIDSAYDVLLSTKMGVDIVTAPYVVYEKLIRNDASYETVEEFLEGWTGREI